MADLQALADKFHLVYMRELAAKAGLSADAMLIGRIAADRESTEQRLYEAAERELGRHAARALKKATWTRALNDYFELSEAERRRLLVGDTSAVAVSKSHQRLTKTTPKPAEDASEQPATSQIALATAIVQNARPHSVTWGLGHPSYNRFAYLPNGHRDLPENAPRAFYDSSRNAFTERDHLVGLAQAHESGAAYWDRATKQAFAIDPDNIYSITPAANMEKGYRDPAEWLPADPSVHVRYAAEWVLIKTRWSLTYDEAELAALRGILGADAGV